MYICIDYDFNTSSLYLMIEEVQFYPNEGRTSSGDVDMMTNQIMNAIYITYAYFVL